MRALSACILLIAILASGSVWLNSEPVRGPASALERVERQMAALGIRKMLHAHDNHDFSSVVVGQMDPDGFTDFRGQIALSGQRLPAYGQLRALCAAGREQPDCWELAYLEVNGRPLDLEAEQTQQQAKADIPEPARPAPVHAALAPETPAPVVMAATRGPATPAPANPRDRQEVLSDTVPGLPAATHRVARPVINTRGGPGTDHPVITRLAEGMPLALVEDQGDWGRFIVLDGTAEGTEVWAALGILEAFGPGEGG